MFLINYCTILIIFVNLGDSRRWLTLTLGKQKRKKQLPVKKDSWTVNYSFLVYDLREDVVRGWREMVTLFVTLSLPHSLSSYLSPSVSLLTVPPFLLPSVHISLLLSSSLCPSLTPSLPISLFLPRLFFSLSSSIHSSLPLSLSLSPSLPLSLSPYLPLFLLSPACCQGEALQSSKQPGPSHSLHCS